MAIIVGTLAARRAVRLSASRFLCMRSYAGQPVRIRRVARTTAAIALSKRPRFGGQQDLALWEYLLLSGVACNWAGD